MHAPAALIVLYAHARELNAAMPGDRYSPAALQQILDAAELALDRAIDLRRYDDASNQASWNWGGTWRAFHGNFNDVYAYHAGDATDAYKVLGAKAFAAHPAELQVRRILKKLRWNSDASNNDTGNGDDDIAVDGADHFLPLWREATARYAISAADQCRAYPPYLELVRHHDPNLLPIDPNRLPGYAEQLKAQTWNCFQHMHTAGVWAAAPLDSWQVYSAGTANAYNGMRPVDHWAATHAFALGLDQGTTSYLNSAERARVLAQLNTLFERTREYFAAYEGQDLNGYYPTIQRKLDGDRATQGVETRPLGSLLLTLNNLEEGTPAPPEASISPTSFAGTGPFTFVIKQPSANNLAELQSALDDRTRIYSWSFIGGTWTRTRLWPQGTGVTWNPPVFDVNAGTATLTTQQITVPGVGPGAILYKFRVATWDADNQWASDTSVH